MLLSRSAIGRHRFGNINDLRIDRRRIGGNHAESCDDLP